MSRKQVKDVAASVKRRLRNLAEERGEDFNFLLTRYAVERLVYRLAQSAYASEFVLKGAMLFHLVSGQYPHRATHDVDLLGRDPSNPSRLVKVFRELCAAAVEEDGLVLLEGTIRADRIRDRDEYHGLRIRLQVRMGSARIPVQVDIGFGDRVTPAPVLGRLATLLDHPAPTFRSAPGKRSSRRNSRLSSSWA